MKLWYFSKIWLIIISFFLFFIFILLFLTLSISRTVLIFSVKDLMVGIRDFKFKI